ncbi:MAG: sortase, partial [Chloroflexi bacterium]|nr:sortase [Chloroflexota bacterium]
YTIEKTPPSVTIEQGSTQSDPTNTGPIIFDVTFSKVVTGFDNSDVDITGMAASPTIVVTGGSSGDTYTVSVSGMADGETVTASIPQGAAQDYLGNYNTASTAADNSVTYDTTGLTIAPGGVVAQPSGAALQNLGAYIGQFTRLEITFAAGANDPTGSSDPDDVTNPDNYLLIQSGPDAIYTTTSCLDVSANGGAVLGDDVQIPTGPVVYNSATFTATVALNNGVPLPYGQYRLFLCGTTSITDLAGNALNDGVDTVLTFETHSAPELPETGFAPGRTTRLPAQPSEAQYMALGDLWLEIPSLGVAQNIIGVPWKEDAWDISWLGSDIGYLDGTAFPTWAGNTVLTGHVYDENGRPGPFVNLGDLSWGDQVSIHAWGRTYTYQVRTVQTQVDPSNTRLLTQSETYDWITLVTCHGYDEQTGAYRWRTVVRAVLIDVAPE